MFLLIIEGGCVFHLLTDRSEYGRGLVVIPPDSPDRTVILKNNFKGYLVTMPSSIISDKWSSKQYASLSEKEVVILKSYCVLMRDVLISPGAAHSSKEMLCLSRAFVASCRQHFDVEIYANSYSRRAEIASGFLKMVEKYGHRERDLSFYSKRLSITQKYLSAVITSATGKKASNMLNERTIEYAKDLLMNTRMSVTDISKEMDFKNPSDFCRYFKNSTGISPNTFRSHGSLAQARTSLSLQAGM